VFKNNPPGFDPAQDPKYRSVRRSREDPPPPPPAALPQPPAGLPSQAYAEERTVLG